MAVIAGYASLQTAVSDYLARSDLTTFIPNFIQNFEERFFRQPKNYGKWMESSLSVSFSSTATIPSDFQALKISYLNGKSNAPLAPMSLEQVLQAYPRSGSSGQPKWIARDGNTFVFGPAPDGTYTLNGTYYAKPVLLRNFSSDAAAHFLIVNAPDLLLYGALLEAEAFLKNDGRIAVWQGFHDRALQDYRDLMRKQDHGGGALQTLAV